VALQQTAQKSLSAWPIATVLLLAFLVASYHLTRESLWDDEGYTIWFVHDDGRPPEGAIQTAQFIRSSLSNVLARVSADVHPPLYFLTLDAWVLLTGESIYTVRLLSAFLGLTALAATYAVGKQLFDPRTALIAVVVLATASFFVYYTREARMYTLLIALSALSMWAYLRFQKQATIRRTVIYGVIMAALLYTHYIGDLIILTQIAHSLLVGANSRAPSRHPIRFALPYILATILYLPWIPALLHQIRAQGGPSALPVPSDWGAISALLLILTSAHWGLYVAPFLLGNALAKIREYKNALILLALWLLMTPLVLLAINAWSRPIFQIRYTIAILPAWALLVAYGLRFSFQRSAVSGQQNTKKRSAIFSVAFVPLWFKFILPIALLIWLAYTQLAMYTQFWPDKPRWEQAVHQMTAIRQPLEPAITSITPQSPATYYDRQYGIRQGITLDLSWRWQETEDIRGYVAHVANAPSVWAIMPSNAVSTWDAVAGLLDDRHIGYRDSVMNMIFYRFDAGAGDLLNFRFGDALAYDSGIGHQLYARAGEPFCFDTSLTALKSLESEKIEWQLTQGYGTVRAALSAEIGSHPAGEAINFSPCIEIPLDTPLGTHHLRMSIMDDAPLPVIESENLYWGEQLVLAQVSVSAGD
jgi:Dolichyl-phosphate-mannose-protein mannosyltransferase